MSTAAEISGGGQRYYSEPRTHRRHDLDWYVEPAWTVETLLGAGIIGRGAEAWDPACGSGTIPRTLDAAGIRCFATDVAERGWGGVHDFLGMEPPPLSHVEWIVTNPPYGVAQEFVERGLTLADSVAVLVQSKFPYSQRRHRLFTQHPPSHLLFLSDRPSMPPGDKLAAGTVEAKGGKTDYLWMVWDRAHEGATVAQWLRKPGRC